MGAYDLWNSIRGAAPGKARQDPANIKKEAPPPAPPQNPNASAAPLGTGMARQGAGAIEANKNQKKAAMSAMFGDDQ
jgi:hypothetical protein